jgi:drug/metabolite transporter (DMT)-like permease
MTALALGLALASAFLHAIWNLMLARTSETEAATAVVFAVAWLVGIPAAALDWHVSASVWPYALASGLLELLYVTLLAGAYARVELSLVYPVARGLAPVLVLAVGTAFLGADSSAQQAAGVCLVALGVLLVRRLQLRGDPLPLLLGLAIAATIAAYTLVDRNGVHHASPLTYYVLILFLPAFAYPALVLARRGRASIRRELRLWNVVAGVLVWAAFALVLEALRRAQAAPVAAVRETSVVIATALAAVVLRERVGAIRIAGAVLVATGVVLIGA